MCCHTMKLSAETFVIAVSCSLFCLDKKSPCLTICLKWLWNEHFIETQLHAAGGGCILTQNGLRPVWKPVNTCKRVCVCTDRIDTIVRRCPHGCIQFSDWVPKIVLPETRHKYESWMTGRVYICLAQAPTSFLRPLQMNFIATSFFVLLIKG